MLTCKTNFFSGLHVFYFMINEKYHILGKLPFTRLARGIQGKRVGRGSLYEIQEQGKQSQHLVLSLHAASTNTHILSMSV